MVIPGVYDMQGRARFLPSTVLFHKALVLSCCNLSLERASAARLAASELGLLENAGLLDTLGLRGIYEGKRRGSFERAPKFI